MKTKLKKLLPVAGVVCGFSSLLNAAQDDRSMQHQNQGMMRQNTQHTNGDDTSFRQITPNAGPRVTNGADVFVTADFIYWTARQDNLAFAYTGVDPSVSDAVASPVDSRGTTYTAPRKYEPGFKVGLGLNLGHDGWDVFLEYTWFRSNNTDTATAGSLPYQRLVPASVAIPSALDFEILTVTNGTGSWRFRFNNFDLELGRNFYVSQYLTLRPHIGLKGNWINQYFDESGSGVWVGDTPLNNLGYGYGSVSSATINRSQKWWGVGIRSGIDTAWYFDKNWSIFGDFALSGLWGRFNVSGKATIDGTYGTPEIQQFVPVWTGANYHTVKYVGEFQLGLRFDYWFSDDDYHFGLSAAWEVQSWINHNQMTFTDLGLQGLTIKARFDF